MNFQREKEQALNDDDAKIRQVCLILNQEKQLNYELKTKLKHQTNVNHWHELVKYVCIALCSIILLNFINDSFIMALENS